MDIPPCAPVSWTLKASANKKSQGTFILPQQVNCCKNMVAVYLLPNGYIIQGVCWPAVVFGKPNNVAVTAGTVVRGYAVIKKL
jgi:hypothetical protein